MLFKVLETQMTEAIVGAIRLHALLVTLCKRRMKKKKERRRMVIICLFSDKHSDSMQ